MNGFARHFFQRGDAILHLDKTAATKRDHAALHGFLFQFDGRGADENQFAYFIVNFHDFVETGTTFVSGVVAVVAASSFVNFDVLGFFRSVARFNLGLRRQRNFFTALSADASHQTLRTDEVNRRRDKEWLDAHVHQAADGLRSAVGVERRKHKVTCKRGLDGNFRGLEVANLADEDHVGILAKESAKSCGEVQADGFLHLHLVHAVKLELDGIFGRHDVGIRLVQQRDRGVKSVGLAGTRGAGDQHHAVRLENCALEFFQGLRLEAELGHVKAEIFFIEQTQDNFFTPERGQAVYAKIELLFLAPNLHLEHDPAVLGQAFLAYIHFGHDLDAARDGIFQLHGRGHDMLQNPVNPEAHAVFFFVGLNVDVTGAFLHRIAQNDVHQLDDGSLVRGLLQLAEVHLLLLSLKFDVRFVSHGRQQFVDVLSPASAVPIRLLNRLHDRRLARHHRLDIEPGHELDIVHGEHVRRIHHGNGQRRPYPAQGQNLVALSRLLGNQLHHRRINFKILQVDGGNAVLPRQEVCHLLIAYEPQ